MRIEEYSVNNLYLIAFYHPLESVREKAWIRAVENLAIAGKHAELGSKTGEGHHLMHAPAWLNPLIERSIQAAKLNRIRIFEVAFDPPEGLKNLTELIQSGVLDNEKLHNAAASSMEKLTGNALRSLKSPEGLFNALAPLLGLLEHEKTEHLPGIIRKKHIPAQAASECAWFHALNKITPKMAGRTCGISQEIPAALLKRGMRHQMFCLKVASMKQNAPLSHIRQASPIQN